MKRIAVLGNREKPGMATALTAIEQWTGQRDIALQTNPRAKTTTKTPPTDGPFGPSTIQQLQDQFRGSDLIVTLGGDGTLLFSAQVAAPLGIPVLSVNLGSLGFHTQVAPPDLISALEAFAGNKARIEQRTMLQVSLDRPKSAGGPLKAIGLNDVVVSKSAWGHMVHLRMHINGRPATDVSADGLLIATPTGSSAYNYAAGGPVLAPTLDALVVNAICPHRMYFSPVVVPADTEVTVEFHPQKSVEEAQFVIDGQPCSTITRDQRLKISKAPMYLPLVVFDDDFYGKLREKLRWGGLS